jgi:hypothetical protein
MLVAKAGTLFFAFLLSLGAPHAIADISAIRQSALPQEIAVLAAYDDAGKLEAYSTTWTSDWKYPVSKEEVATRLGKDLGFLSLAVKDHPDNIELLLLTGLVARYAYNLEVNGSHDVAIHVLDKATSLVPGDFRARWFRATLQCQTAELKAGAEGFLAIENEREWDQLPISFWEDYTNCALLSNLPVHTLRAIGYLEKLSATKPAGFDSTAEIAHNRIVPFDPKRDYEPKELWRGGQSSDNVEFTNTTCGIRFLVHGDWSVYQIAAKKGTCVAVFNTGPYKAKHGSLQPSVMLMVKQPEGSQTLDDFATKYGGDGVFTAYSPSRCPAEKCLAKSGIQTGMYKGNGDGHDRVVVFEREEPKFPGLVFEAPVDLPKTDGGEGPKYYRPSETQGRIPGRLYYLVLLDTASSIEEPAMKDFDFFLSNLIVE